MGGSFRALLIPEYLDVVGALFSRFPHQSIESAKAAADSALAQSSSLAITLLDLSLCDVAILYCDVIRDDGGSTNGSGVSGSGAGGGGAGGGETSVVAVGGDVGVGGGVLGAHVPSALRQAGEFLMGQLGVYRESTVSHLLTAGLEEKSGVGVEVGVEVEMEVDEEEEDEEDDEDDEDDEKQITIDKTIMSSLIGLDGGSALGKISQRSTAKYNAFISEKLFRSLEELTLSRYGHR